MKTVHQIISISLLLFAFLCKGIDANAQDTDMSKRNISLKVVNKKGKPVRNLVVQSISTGQAGITDSSGEFVFEDMTDSDTLSVRLSNNSHVIIPVKEMDFIIVKALSAKYYSYFDQQDEDNNAMTVTKLPLSTTDNLILDVPSLLKQKTYASLVELLRDHAIGITVSPSGSVAPVRGPNSIQGTKEPLVVVDGVEVGIIAEANNMVSIYSIKNIEINRNGAGYGTRGAGGVILIKTQ